MTSIMMNTFKNSQIMILFLIASLLIITPLLSTSLRSKYLYFIINLLFIAVGAESGLLSFFFKSPENKKPHVITTELININKTELTAQSDNIVITNKTELAAQSDNIVITRTVKVVDKCSSEKILGSPKVLHRVKKSPSMPSIFFIGGCEQNAEAEELFDESDVEDFNEQELLFQKAEMFIGDFYKQLKMQREESWKKLHGNIPVYHGSNLKIIDRRVRLPELVLRCVICGLAILSAVLIGTDTQVKEIFTIRKKAKFTDMKALVFVVIANGLAAAYSLVQVLRCVLSMIRGSVLFNKPLAWAIFSGDQIMAYLTLAAVAAAAQSAVFAKFGQTELQWMKTCNMYAKFCNQVGEGIASAVLASVSMVVLSAISAFSLFRLYGDNKEKSSTRW